MSYLEESSEKQLEEIDLSVFTRIIKKRKKIISGLFLIGLTTGIIWYFLTPSSYEGKIILKIGESDGAVEAAEELKRGVYGDYPNIEVVNPSNTDVVEISLAAKDHDKTKEFLEKIKTDILLTYNQKTDGRKQGIEQEISFLENKIENLKKDISYFMARGEQVALFKLEIYNTEKRINDLEKEKANISMNQVIKGPDVTEERPGYSAIFFAGVLGLFIGLLLAFFIDSLEKK